MTHPENTTPANPAQGVSEAISAIARLLTYGEARDDPKGTLFRFDNGARFFLSTKDVEVLTAAIGAGGQAVAERCAAIADDLSKDELFLDDEGRYGAELTAATIRDEFGLDAEPSRSRVTKIDGGYLHEWIDADGEHHKHVHPANLSALSNPPAQPGWRDIPVTDETVSYIMQYGGRCRECADAMGVCPTSGLPCIADEARSAIRHTLRAINYGMRNGFLPAAPLPGGAK